MPGITSLALTPHVTATVSIQKIYGNARIWNQVSKSFTNAQSQKILHSGSWEKKNKAFSNQKLNAVRVIQTQVVENTNVVTLFF